MKKYDNKRAKSAAFKLGLIAGAIALSCSFGVSAQQQELEEIVVLGIRGSLQRTLDLKKNSDGIVDGISSEDIGKFPDSNLAESLQRITGVTIDRSNGEGSKVSIRGINPSLNVFTLNGLTLTSGDDGRDVSFDVFPSEIVRRVEVIKSPTADVPEGGIGGIVNLVTVDPLDVSGRHLSVAAKVLYDELSEESDPQYTVAYVDQFLDDKFGVSATFVQQDRTSRQDFFNSNGFRQRDIDGDGQTESHLFNPRSRFAIQDRERQTFNLGLQWRPNDTSNYYLKANYSKFDINDDSSLLASNVGFQNFGPQRILKLSPEGDVLAGEFGTRIRSNSQTRQIENENLVLDLGADWDIADDWNLSVQYGHSDAEETFGDNSFRLLFDLFTTVRYDLTENPNVPLLQTINSGGVGTTTQPMGVIESADVTDPNNYTFGQVSFDPRASEDSEDSFRLDVTHNLEGGLFKEVKFGARFSDREKSRSDNNERVFRPNLRDPKQRISLASFARAFPASSGFLSEGNAPFPRSFALPNLNDALAGIESFFSAQGINIRENVATNPLEQFNFQEETTAAYVRGDFEFGRYSGNVGLRYVSTDTVSSGFRVDLVSGQVEPVSFGSDYDELLPSFNLRAEINENVIARFAAARFLARPSPLDSAVRQNCLAAVFLRQCAEGNPLLEPQLGEQLDLAIDWYFSDVGYVSLGAFYKNLDTVILQDAFVADRTIPIDLFDADDLDGVTNNGDGTGTDQFQINAPVNLNGGVIQGFEFAYQQSFDKLPAPWNSLGAIFNYTYVDSDISNVLENGDVAQFQGVSDSSWNAVLFYEVDRWSVRASVSYRDEFVNAAVGNAEGAASITEEFLQVDLSGSYNINDNFQVFIEALNINDEPIRRFSGRSVRLTDFEITGPRYSLGLKYSF